MTFEELIKNHSAEVIEKLITEILSKEVIEIHFDFLEGDQWSIVTSHQYEEDKEISVRLHLNDYYDLHFGYYNDEDEFIFCLLCLALHFATRSVDNHIVEISHT